MLLYLFSSLYYIMVVLLSLLLVFLVSFLTAVPDPIDEGIISFTLFVLQIGSASVSSLLKLHFPLLPILSLLFTDVIFNPVCLAV